MFKTLVEEYKSSTDSTDPAQHGLKWALGNAIGTVSKTGDADILVELIRDRRNGSTRDIMVLRLADLDRARAEEVLIDLLLDGDCVLYAIAGLRKLKSKKGKFAIERFANSKEAAVRKEARTALRTIAKN